jgi:hypothetical protein
MDARDAKPHLVRASNAGFLLPENLPFLQAREWQLCGGAF